MTSRSPPVTGREALANGVEDVSGAYYIKRKPLTATELQEVVEPVVARALTVPNEVSDLHIRQFCFAVSDLEREKRSNGIVYNECMLDDEARDWLSSYLASRKWHVRSIFRSLRKMVHGSGGDPNRL